MYGESTRYHESCSSSIALSKCTRIRLPIASTTVATPHLKGCRLCLASKRSPIVIPTGSRSQLWRNNVRGVACPPTLEENNIRSCEEHSKQRFVRKIRFIESGEIHNGFSEATSTCANNLTTKTIGLHPVERSDFSQSFRKSRKGKGPTNHGKPRNHTSPSSHRYGVAYGSR